MDVACDDADTAVSRASSRNGAVLSEQSVLAENFVPRHLREVNEWPVTAPYTAATSRAAAAVSAGPRGLLVPFVPICYCLGRQRISHSTPLHSFPMVDVPNDSYFALHKNRDDAVASSSSSSAQSIHSNGEAFVASNGLTDDGDESLNPSYKSPPLPRPQQSATPPVVPTVDNISNLDEYLSTWQELLRLERVEVLQRYENYSRYGRPVNVRNIFAESVTPKPNLRRQAPVVPSEHVATIYIPGIADASPPIQIGDVVLVRPMHLVSLPFTNQTGAVAAPLLNRSLADMSWSHPVHVVEIQANVLSVQRASSPSTTDAIVLSWIQPSEWDVLKHTLQMRHRIMGHDASQLQPVFNVRFVPSTTTLQRCLTALQWLSETFKDNNPQACMELLFPTTAPTVTLSAGQVAANDILSRSTGTSTGSSTTLANSPQPRLQLNDKQASFVSMVLARTQQPSTHHIRPPMVLTGPAGTGKTKTMLSAVHAILSSSSPSSGGEESHPYRILICTPSHTAADVITRRLGEQLNRDQLFRLYSADRPVATVPVEVLGFCRQSSDQTGTFVLPDVAILMQFQVIVCTCSDAHLLYRIGLTNQQLRIRRRCFELFLSKTCEGTNLSCTLTGVDDPHFTHLFIDEAAQATEPETLIPFSVVMDTAAGYCSRAVEIALVGDPRQLSPSVYSSAAAAAGLDRSLLERLLQRPVTCLGGGRDHMLGPDLDHMEDWIQYSFQKEGHEQLSVFLTTNYRGHPSFLMMPSVLFYSDKLQGANNEKEQDAGESYWCEKLRHVENLSDPVVVLNGNSTDEPDEVRCRKQFNWPLHMRGVIGKETSVTVESGFASSSWENMAEALVVSDICATLHEKGVSSKSIGVMASFRGQVVLIRKLLRNINLGGVNVGTIEDYQSVEHDVIILSLVRATESFVEHDVKNRMGVFGQPKRANVALTRAEFLFIVVGNPDVMAKDAAVWLPFMLFAHRNGLFYGEAPEESSTLTWNETRSVVRYPPKLSSFKLAAANGIHRTSERDTHNAVTVGTLERALRS